MSNALRIILRIVISIGACAGLVMWFYCGVHADWPNALISFGVYSFSLVMLS